MEKYPDVSCNGETCLLKDINEIHNLTRDEEQQVLSRLAKIIFPNRDDGLPGR